MGDTGAGGSCVPWTSLWCKRWADFRCPSPPTGGPFRWPYPTEVIEAVSGDSSSVQAPIRAPRGQTRRLFCTCSWGGEYCWQIRPGRLKSRVPIVGGLQLAPSSVRRILDGNSPTISVAIGTSSWTTARSPEDLRSQRAYRLLELQDRRPLAPSPFVPVGLQDPMTLGPEDSGSRALGPWSPRALEPSGPETPRDQRDEAR
jgi:hypothetical protein